jgi:hypothetical protein
MPRVIPAVLGASLLAAVAGAESVQVSVGTHGLQVRADRAPLAAVLDELSKQTGADVTYDGPAPNALVTLSFQASDPVEAFVRSIEGMSVSYAAAIDPRSGALKSVLIVSAASAGPGSNGRAAGSNTPAPRASSGNLSSDGEELPAGFSEVARRPVRSPESMSPPPEENQVEIEPAPRRSADDEGDDRRGFGRRGNGENGPRMRPDRQNGDRPRVGMGGEGMQGQAGNGRGRRRNQGE